MTDDKREDKRTIGVVPKNDPSLSRLVQIGNFAQELDAARFAMAYAMKRGIALGSIDGAQTKWNIGTWDPEGGMRSLLEALYPDADGPYRTMEYLLNRGLELLAPETMAHVDIFSLIVGSEPS